MTTLTPTIQERVNQNLELDLDTDLDGLDAILVKVVSYKQDKLILAFNKDNHLSESQKDLIAAFVKTGLNRKYKVKEGFGKEYCCFDIHVLKVARDIWGFGLEKHECQRHLAEKESLKVKEEDPSQV
jgi:hypothetical protein